MKIEIGPELGRAMEKVVEAVNEHNRLAVDDRNTIRDTLEVGDQVWRAFGVDAEKIACANGDSIVRKGLLEVAAEAVGRGYSASEIEEIIIMLKNAVRVVR